MFKRHLITIGIVSIFSSCYASDLPNIKILATGGTIAGTAPSVTQMTGYKAADLAIETLLKAVPALNDIANVSGEQFINLSSQNMTDEIMLTLAKRCNELLLDPSVKGIVITHGTDTLEETAYFLNLTVKSQKPVVIVGSMRPATALSADGPLNLFNAVKIASSDKAIGKGVLVAMNDEINGARDVTKTNTSTVSTFKAPELGLLGYMAAGKPEFLKSSEKKHTYNSEFDIQKLDKLPRVDIVYSYVNADGVAVDAFSKAGAKGIILAGTGNGSMHDNAFPSLAKASESGIVVVRSARTGNGMVTISHQEWADAGLLEGNTLNPQKARILLQLALTKTKDLKEIQRIFNEY